MILRTVFAAAVAALALTVAARAQVTIAVDTARPGPRLSPLLHGIFFEEINHAGDGGLYAEKLRDRRFLEGDAHWKGVGDGAVRVANGALVIDAGAAVETDGYWGIGIERGKALRLRATVDGGPLTAELRDGAGKIVARGVLKSGKAALRLVPTATVGQARLRLTAGGAAGRIVEPSLMPEKTFGKAPIREDLGRFVAELKPSFVRFPGGCYVEGDRLVDKFDWKTTLGPAAQRGGTRCIWGYTGTNGLGYHEFLQWAEDLKAEPLFVINCGMSHRDTVPLEQMDAVVQDALDALEYANGDAKTTQWGAQRARNGHPKPFGLKLIEIGNENGGPAYDARYALIYRAIKAKYPQVRCIANDWGGVPKSAPVELIDEHYYSTASFFQRQAARYDRYDRRGPQIYVGEYAVTNGAGTGNLLAALGEAAFITGMERNSDVVAMASYAPLLVNANNRAWNPDAIVFDASRVYGTPSYWVQRLFSQNRGDLVLPTAVRDTRPVSAAPLRGKVGVGTWRTAAEYAELRVDGKPVELAPVRGAWSRGANDTWKQTDLAENRAAVGGDPNTGDMTLTLKARKLSGDEGFLILFHVDGADDYVWWNVGGWGNQRHNIEWAVGGGKEAIARDVPGRIENDRWYAIKIVTEGRRIRCYLDDALIHDTVVPPPPTDLLAVSTRDEKTGDVLVKVVHFGAAPVTAQLVLDGGVRLSGGGTATVLTSASPLDENSFDAPEKIVPKLHALSGIAPRFAHTFPAHSVTLLRLPTVRY
jgi:alpha-L-arabinofuranosidase